MLQEILQQNFAAIVITLFLILFITTGCNFDVKANKLFLSITSCILALITLEIIDSLCAPDLELKVFRRILSAGIYSLRPTVIYYILLILSRKVEKRSLILYRILLIISVLSAILSIFFKIGFRHTAQGALICGPLALISVIISGIYLLLLIILTLKKYRHDSSKEYLLTLAVVAMFLVGWFLEFVLKYSYVINACIAITATFYYLFFLTSTDNHDLLTGALVRRRFYLDAEKFSDTLTSIIALDLNDLKLWNDKQGHDAGDLALSTMATVVTSVLPKHSYLYRTGGDEFMILCNKLNANELMELIASIRAAMAKTPYSCAIGYAFYNRSVGIDKLCLLADDMMYKDKIAIKGPEYAAKYSRQTTRTNER